MANELVCYKNDLNLVPMRDFNPVEMDLFFSICSQMREKGLNTIQFSFNDLKEISDYKPTSTKRFVDDIESVYRKLLTLQIYEKNEHKRSGFVLFPYYEIDIDKGIVEIGINHKLEHVLNKISTEFTKFELTEFTSLRSSYSKTAYRQLKQYRKTGYVLFKLDDFKNIFCIPNGYQMCNIDQRVLKLIKEELAPIFKGLKVKKLSFKKGRKITHIEFTFQSDDDQLKNGKYRIRKNDKYIEKDILEMSDLETKKIFLDLPTTLSEKLNQDEDLVNKLEILLLEKRKLKEKNQEIEKIQGQVEFDV